MTDTPLSAQAIDAALKQDWKEAIRINLALIKQNNKDIDSLSRLAYAYLQSSNLREAKRTYKRVLTLDRYNPIALKNSKKLSMLKKKRVTAPVGHNVSPISFLEEPGKTKVVECIHVAPSHILSTLSAGQEVYLKGKNHGVDVRSGDNAYLAALPDDLSFRLKKLIAAGNTYQTIIKSVDKNSLKIILRELTRGKRFAHQPSFAAQIRYVPFHRPTHAHTDTPDMTPTGEAETEESSSGE